MGVCNAKATKTNKVEPQVEQSIVKADAPELVKEATESNDVKLQLEKGHITQMGVCNGKATQTDELEPQVEESTEGSDATDLEQQLPRYLT